MLSSRIEIMKLGRVMTRIGVAFALAGLMMARSVAAAPRAVAGPLMFLKIEQKQLDEVREHLRAHSMVLHLEQTGRRWFTKNTTLLVSGPSAELDGLAQTFEKAIIEHQRVTGLGFEISGNVPGQGYARRIGRLPYGAVLVPTTWRWNRESKRTAPLVEVMEFIGNIQERGVKDFIKTTMGMPMHAERAKELEWRVYLPGEETPFFTGSEP